MRVRVCGYVLPPSVMMNQGSDWRGHPGWGQSAECSAGVKNYGGDDGNTATVITHPGQEAHICSRDRMYTLELFGYIIVLGVLQYLRQTGDDVTLNLHRCYWHQFHELGGHFLQITGQEKQEKRMITGLMEQIHKKKPDLTTCHHRNYHLAVNDSVEPFQLVNDRAWYTEPSIAVAVKIGKSQHSNKMLHKYGCKKWWKCCQVEKKKSWNNQPIKHKFRNFLK